MQDLNDLFYFVQVVDHGGFAPAGRALGMPKSKLSRRIALLEERLGVRLIQRSTRRFVVTDLGRTYYGHARAALVEAAAAEEAIQRTRAEPRGIVRMSCPTTLLDIRVGPMLAEFLRQPTLKLDIALEGFALRIEVGFEHLHRRPRFLALDATMMYLRLQLRLTCGIVVPAIIHRRQR